MADKSDVKSTLNLPQTAFAMKASLAQKEPEIIRTWEAEGLYEKILGKRAGRPVFILHDGPPYANGHIHMGTALNKILKDFIVKSRSMLGHYAPYVPGWDCHGLPIEIHVDRQLGEKKTSLPVTVVREECRKYAEKFIAIQREEFKRLGVLGAWARPYLTMHPA
jgi:isoleucyl-tRNA synthetase